MRDGHTSETLAKQARSRVMRAVKASDTAPEMTVRRLLHRLGYRFRLQRGDLPGRPDIVLPGRRSIVFVNGCFWHGHACPRGARQPKTNADYWHKKILRNLERDRIVRERLKQTGWNVLDVWECETNVRSRDALVLRLVQFLGPAGSSFSRVGQADHHGRCHASEPA